MAYVTDNWPGDCCIGLAILKCNARLLIKLGTIPLQFLSLNTIKLAYYNLCSNLKRIHWNAIIIYTCSTLEVHNIINITNTISRYPHISDYINITVVLI